MSYNLDKAVKNMLKLVQNDSHGYSQAHRSGPDYDCSSSISKALHDAGFPIPYGCNTSSIYAYLIEAGFKIISPKSALLPGDLWLRRRDSRLAKAKGSGHIAMMYDSRHVMEFSSSRGHHEPGDQTKTEAWLHDWNPARKYDFEFLLRYTPSGSKVHSSSPTKYYKKYTGKSLKIDTIFKRIGASYGNWRKRKPVAAKNGIANYTGTYAQNIFLINLAKEGKLKK